jgi:hypothetical protein
MGRQLMAKPDQSSRVIPFLRIGNSWMVGKHVNRIVPVYVLQNLLAPSFKRHDRLGVLKDLAFSSGLAGPKLGSTVKVSSAHLAALEQTTYGVISPDRRIFRDSATGGASREGSVFPLTGAMTASAASDDGLGKRLREALDKAGPTFDERVRRLLLPAEPTDAMTAFVRTIMGGMGEESDPRLAVDGPALGQLDAAIVEFVLALTPASTYGDRVALIRDLAIGAYFATIFRLVAGPVIESGAPLPMVFAYGGLPPGPANDPIVRAATQSFQNWIQASWRATASVLAARLVKAMKRGRGSTAELRDTRIRLLLSDVPKKDVDRIIDLLGPTLSRESKDEEFCRSALEALDFPKSEFARRVRSLGANIGLVGPDRGTGNPRVVIDTPLLGVLVRAIVGTGSMEYRAFLREVRNRFGLVFGLSDDPDIVSDLDLMGSDGLDQYEILAANEELLRERMLRAGLARSYSDSHTEVIGR